MKLLKELKYSLYIMIHPFDGFYDLKFEKRGSMKSAGILYLLFVLSVIIKRQLTGYLFNPNDTEDMNFFLECSLAILPYILWCVSNWCITTLMDGEGKFSDIVKATGFALTPYTIFNIISVIASQFLTLEESSVYGLITAIAMIWSFGLVFLGMLTTQQYSLLKGIAAALITLVGMAIILFLSFLVFYLAQQLVNFIRELWSELSFRLNE